MPIQKQKTIREYDKQLYTNKLVYLDDIDKFLETQISKTDSRSRNLCSFITNKETESVS